MGLVLGLFFLVTLALATLASLRVHKLAPFKLKEQRLLLATSLVLACLVVSFYIWHLTLRGSFNGHSVYMDSHSKICALLLAGLLSSFIPHKITKLTSLYTIASGIMIFVIVNLWASWVHH